MGEVIVPWLRVNRIVIRSSLAIVLAQAWADPQVRRSLVLLTYQIGPRPAARIFQGGGKFHVFWSPARVAI